MYLYTMRDYMEIGLKVDINERGLITSINDEVIDPTPIEDYGDWYLSEHPINDAFDKWVEEMDKDYPPLKWWE